MFVRRQGAYNGRARGVIVSPPEPKGNKKNNTKTRVTSFFSHFARLSLGKPRVAQAPSARHREHGDTVRTAGLPSASRAPLRDSPGEACIL